MEKQTKRLMITHTGKMKWVLTAVILCLIPYFYSCKKPDSDTGSPPEESTTLSTSFIENLSRDLLAAGYSQKQADIISAEANLQIFIDEVGQTADISLIAPCIIKGAQLSLANPAVGLLTSDEKLAAIEVIVASITNSLNGNITSASTSIASQSSISDSPNQPLYATASTASYSDVLKQIVNTSIMYLDEAGIESTGMIAAVKAIVKKVSCNLTNAGVQSSEMAAVAKSIATAAVGALDDAGISSSDMSDAVKAVTSGALIGLKEDGQDNTSIAAISDDITEGTILGLKNAGVSDSDIDSMVEIVKTGVNEGLAEAGLTTQEIDDVQTAIEVAANLGRRGLSLKSFLSFTFLASQNTALTDDVTGMIDEVNRTISLTVPYGTSVTALVATFTTTGESVKVGDTNQTRGSTANDYSSSITFVVVDENGETAEYTVTVNVLTYILTVSTSPADGATNVDRSGSFSVSFSASMNTSTITTNTADTDCSGSIQVSKDNFSTCVQISSVPVASNDDKTFTITPTAAIKGITSHKIKVTTSVRDSRGNLLSSNFTTSSGFFTKPGPLTGVWTFVDGNGTNGINKDVLENAERPQLIVFNSKLYATWHESNGTAYQIRVAEYNGSSSWNFIDGSSTTGINKNTGQHAYAPQLTVFNSKLYATWYESNSSTINQIRVAEWGGSSTWSFVDGNGVNGINYNAIYSASLPQLTVFNNKLYSTWSEKSSANIDQVRTAEWDGNQAWNFTDGNTALGLNTSTDWPARATQLTVFNSKLYITSNDKYNGSAKSQIQVREWDGGSIWSYKGGGGSVGITNDSIMNQYNAQLMTFNSNLFVIYREDTINCQIRVAKWDGSVTWNFVDPDSDGINKNIANNAFFPQLSEYNSGLYAAWYETNGTKNQIRVAKYDNIISWNFVDGNGSNGINKDPNTDAVYPQLISFDSRLYAIWNETNLSGVKQIRVAVAEVE